MQAYSVQPALFGRHCMPACVWCAGTMQYRSVPVPVTYCTQHHCLLYCTSALYTCTGIQCRPITSAGCQSQVPVANRALPPGAAAAVGRPAQRDSPRRGTARRVVGGTGTLRFCGQPLSTKQSRLRIPTSSSRVSSKPESSSWFFKSSAW